MEASAYQGNRYSVLIPLEDKPKPSDEKRELQRLGYVARKHRRDLWRENPVRVCVVAFISAVLLMTRVYGVMIPVGASIHVR